MKLGRYVTVDDGGNYVTERSHKDKKNNNSSQRELGPPVVKMDITYSKSNMVRIDELVGSIRYGEPVGSTTVNSLMNSLVRLELVGSVTNY